MPTYDYKCAKCEHTFSVKQSMLEDKLKECPSCLALSLERQIVSRQDFILRGPGWFSNEQKGKYHE